MRTSISMFAIACLFAIAGTVNGQGGDKAPSFSEAEKLAIQVQGICPVTGENLGSMGDPVKVQMGEQFAYLCCKGCIGKQASAEHWQTIQIRMAKAQGTCPIMGKPVTTEMKSTVVQGQQIFVCCPPCIEKIQADPATALAKVSESYTSFVAAEAGLHSAHYQMLAQGICPVSGEKLGSMGEPIKARMGEQDVFLCCKGCVGKDAKPEHWATIQTNLMKAQGVCPVMEEELPADSKSVVVEGRQIFVCCPPCIEKIQADPAMYVAKLDGLFAKSLGAAAHDHEHKYEGEKDKSADHAAHNHDK